MLCMEFSRKPGFATFARRQQKPVVDAFLDDESFSADDAVAHRAIDLELIGSAKPQARRLEFVLLA